MGLRITALLSVFQAMEYLPQVMRCVYDHADQIIVSDGVIQQFNKNRDIPCTQDGGSTDGTCEFVLDFPDPDNKIDFRSGGWEYEKDKRQEMVGRATGDWMMTIDSDEVYKAEDLVWMRQQLEANPKLTTVWLHHYRFCGDFWHYYRWPGGVWERLHKGAKLYGYRELWRNGGVLKYPYTNSKGHTEQQYHEQLWIPAEREIICYHYSNVCTKEKAYRKRMISVGLGHKMKTWDRDSFGVGITNEEYEQIRNMRPFTGQHPEVMKDHPYMTNPPAWLQEVKA